MSRIFRNYAMKPTNDLIVNIQTQTRGRISRDVGIAYYAKRETIVIFRENEIVLTLYMRLCDILIPPDIKAIQLCLYSFCSFNSNRELAIVSSVSSIHSYSAYSRAVVAHAFFCFVFTMCVVMNTSPCQYSRVNTKKESETHFTYIPRTFNTLHCIGAVRCGEDRRISNLYIE